jgi:hypothetical protein
MNSASLCSLAGRYDNPTPLRFLALIDSLKIPALVCVAERPLLFRGVGTGQGLVDIRERLVHLVVFHYNMAELF